MEKSNFKVGDRVYNSTSGWCVVIEPDTERSNSFGMCSDVRIERTDEKVSAPNAELSFTEYELKGFTHERPSDYQSWEGKYCIFWDGHSDRFLIDIFKGYYSDRKFKFASGGSDWENGKLLSEVVLEELGITNEKKQK